MKKKKFNHGTFALIFNFILWLCPDITMKLKQIKTSSDPRVPKNSSSNIMRSAKRIRAPRWASPRDSVPQGAPLPPKAGRGRSPLQRIFDTGLADRQAGHVWSPGRKRGAFFRSSIDVATPYIYKHKYKDTLMINVTSTRTCARIVWCDAFCACLMIQVGLISH